MISKEDSARLAALLERNQYVSDPISARNIYGLLLEEILPYYDESRFYLSNLAYAYRKIIAVDSICRELGEYEVYPINERDFIMIAMLADLHKVHNPFDREITNCAQVVDFKFNHIRDYYFHNYTDFYDLIESTYSKRVCLKLLPKLLHDVNILVKMEPNWYFCSAWHDYRVINRCDLDDYDHGIRNRFKPSTDTDEELMKKLWVRLRSETAGNNNWHNLYIPELKTSKYFSSAVRLTEEAINDYESFKNIVEKNEYISYKWPV